MMLFNYASIRWRGRRRRRHRRRHMVVYLDANKKSELKIDS